MKFHVLPFLALAAAAFVSGHVSAQTPFNGEVLVAPPPPNWTGGAPEPTGTGIRREWRRGFMTEGGVVERVVITRSENQKDRVARLAAQDLSKAITVGCAKPKVSEIKYEKAVIGTTAAFTARCTAVKDTPADTALFAMGKIFIGDFYTYAVRRVWTGHKDDPGSPANSPRTGEQWAAFFARIAVCNTLTSPCDSAQAEIVHAHPRFTTMRALPVVNRPVMTPENALKAARRIGDLTGRAEACGEDVEPLLGKIDRMFARITENDQDSSRAVKMFNMAREKGLKAQDAKEKASCGEVLRTFRQHPSRVGAFYRYAQEFL